MISTEDFEISLVKPEDAPLLHSLMVGNVDRFKLYFPLTLASNASLKKSVAFLENILEDAKAKNQFLFAIRAHKAIAGLVYIKNLNWEDSHGEFAYCIDKKYTGLGWMTKAITLLSEYAFKTYKLDTLKIIAHPTNISSVRIAEKCGFTFIKILKDGYTPPNSTPLDMHLFERYR